MTNKCKKYLESLKKPGVKYVGSPATSGFTYMKGDTVWVMPVRYWETQEPIQATIRETTRVACDAGDQYSLLLDGVDNGALAGYLCADRVFYVKANAVRHAELLAELKSNKQDDEVEVMVDRMLEDQANGEEKTLAEYLDLP